MKSVKISNRMDIKEVLKRQIFQVTARWQQEQLSKTPSNVKVMNLMRVYHFGCFHRLQFLDIIEGNGNIRQERLMDKGEYCRN